jgi:hypothetical protein
MKSSSHFLIRAFPWVLVILLLALTLPGSIHRYTPEGRRAAARSEAFNACWEASRGVVDQQIQDCVATNVSPPVAPR